MKIQTLNPMQQHEVSKAHAIVIFSNKETVLGASLTQPEKLIKMESLSDFQQFAKFYIV